MQIRFNAGACPGEIKGLLFCAAKLTETNVTLVANQPIRTPLSQFIDSFLVLCGMPAADQLIVELVSQGGRVITVDIPRAT